MQRIFRRPLLATVLLGSVAGLALLGATAAGAAPESSPAASAPSPLVSVELGQLSVNVSLPLDLGQLIQIKPSTGNNGQSSGRTHPTHPSRASHSSHPSHGSHANSSNPGTARRTSPRPATTALSASASQVVVAGRVTTAGSAAAAVSTPAASSPASSTPAPGGASTRPAASSVARTSPARRPVADSSIQLMPGDAPAQFLGLLIALMMITALGVAGMVRFSGHRGARQHSPQHSRRH